ncbi:hypothetical protein COCMIDRAFT_8279 [Bipolaris oryzae ATCC 44560]|uniref:Uncharacterized protein n=1 Tax=Bipolaris oryzae ATCC 44560 TaxID=930090 RepID=W6YX52_COCMI|nr:uncharacterized protein COCMIDRAFT_8279 [Bipolaris oryzae ATCC 44560]EUC42103.1 hypothetical protein COCMIDRAFT_8279 [Bipolaris oryzae ATCC 44560]
MRSVSILSLATAVAADYGYGVQSTSSKLGYTTVYPGHGKEPVTVTAQYQPVPTYVNGEWSEYEAVSTVITDGYGKEVTVTATNQDVTVYATKKTITHTVTATPEGYAHPTGYYRGSGESHTNKTWYELCEEIHEMPYDHIGPHALPRYPGNPKYTGNKDEQGVTIKKYSGGKWSTYMHTFTYGAPKPQVTTFDAPGVYTVPANDMTVATPTIVTAEQTYHAVANKPVTYGGQIAEVTKPTTIAAVYIGYETEGTMTNTITHSTTVTCSTAGTYTIVKPTTTVYDHDTTVIYPSITQYEAGVYHHPAETVTVTEAHQPYTCSFEQTSTYPAATSASAYSSAPVYSSAPSYSTGEATSTTPYAADPSSDYDEPIESYGHASAGYVKRGGVLQRRKAAPAPANAHAKFAILV